MVLTLSMCSIIRPYAQDKVETCINYLVCTVVCGINYLMYSDVCDRASGAMSSLERSRVLYVSVIVT